MSAAEDPYAAGEAADEDEPDPAAGADVAAPGLDDAAIQALVTRLARPHRSGGWMIERAPLLAAGTSFAAIVRWIEAHGGEAEAVKEAPPTRGLYSGRASRAPVQSSRWLLPPSALD